MESSTNNNRASDSWRGQISTLFMSIFAPLIGRIRRPIPQLTSYNLDITRYALIQIGYTLGKREKLDQGAPSMSDTFTDFVGNTCLFFKTYVEQCVPTPTSTSSWLVVPRMLSYLDSYTARDCFVTQFSWGVPSMEALEMIKKYAFDQKVLEIFAGSGLWSFLLRLMAVHVVATDREPKADGFCHVRSLTAVKAVQLEKDANLLFICWAPSKDPADYDALVEFHGDYVVTVSEGRGGRIGSDQFWEYLHKHFVCVDGASIPTWYGNDDRLDVWHRLDGQ